MLIFVFLPGGCCLPNLLLEDLCALKPFPRIFTELPVWAGLGRHKCLLLYHGISVMARSTVVRMLDMEAVTQRHKREHLLAFLFRKV